MTIAVPLLALLAAAPAGRVVTLDEAVRAARANQPLIQQARAGTAAAEARADEALAPLLPQVVGSAGFKRQSDRSLAPLPSGPDFSTWSAGGTLSQLVWDFGQASGRWQSARESATAQRDSERATELQALFSVRTAFFGARAAKDLVGVAHETLANQEAHLRQIQGFVEVGTRPEIDLAQARTDRANAQVQVINSENGYETAKAQLNQAMGIEAPTDYDVADDALAPVEGEELPIDALLAEAVRARPDVSSLEGQARAQEATLGSVRGAYLPSLGVSAGLADSGPALDTTVLNWSASATLTWNLFQGGLTRAQEREARANLASFEAQVAGIRQQVRLDVDQARLAVRADKAALAAAGEALVNARERLRLAEGRYQIGAGSVIELGDAQVALTSAAAQRVQADYNLSSARAQLLRALGRVGG